MSYSLSLPKVKTVSPDKKRLYYEKILSDTPYDKNNNNNNNNNKIKNIQINKKNQSTNKSKNINIDNIQTTEAISNIIDLINDNNLNIFYKEDTSNFKRNIDQLNLKFYLETEKIISSNQNKSKEENYYFYSNKLFLILFKQINLYIKEIERLNALMINSVKDTDNMKKKLAIFIRKQNDFETKEQIIQTLKYSVSSLEKKLSNVLLSENNLRQEIQKLKKEKDYYYEYYKAHIISNNKNNLDNKNKGKNNINKSQTINDLQKNNNNNENSKYNTKDNFFTNTKDIILLNEANNLNLSSNEHKRNNSENDYSINNNNNNDNNKLSVNLQKYNDNSPKRKGKNTIKIKNNGNNNTNSKSIIRLCNYYSHNIEIDIPLGFKSKSPGKPFKSKNLKDLHLSKGKNNVEKYLSQKSTIINENKLDLNIVSNNNNTFIFDNSFIKRNKTIYNTINPNKDLSINRLFKNSNNLDKSNINENEKFKNKKINSVIVNKESIYKDLNTEMTNLNNLENLLIEVKEYILSNENKSNNNKKINNKIKNIPKNKSNSLQNNNSNNNNGKKNSSSNTNFK